MQVAQITHIGVFDSTHIHITFFKISTDLIGGRYKKMIGNTKQQGQEDTPDPIWQ